MGEVYKARDSRLDPLVAIKVLSRAARQPTHSSSSGSLVRPKSISALNDPNICTLYDVGEARSQAAVTTHYLVMEYLEGQSLAERLAQRRIADPRSAEDRLQSCPCARTRRIGMRLSRIAILEAGQRVPRAGHQPATPSTTKLLDFGFARPAGRSAPARWTANPRYRRLTALGPFSEPSRYMAPEQIEGERG